MRVTIANGSGLIGRFSKMKLAGAGKAEGWSPRSSPSGSHIGRGDGLKLDGLTPSPGFIGGCLQPLDFTRLADRLSQSIHFIEESCNRFFAQGFTGTGHRRACNRFISLEERVTVCSEGSCCSY